MSGTTASMESTKQRRDTFPHFAADAIFGEDNKAAARPTAPTAREVRQHNGAWERHVHSASLLGYSFQQSFVVLLFIIYLGSLEWSVRNEEGVPVLNKWAVLHGVWTPIVVIWPVTTWANIAQSTMSEDSGPKYALVPIVVGLVLCPTTYAIHWALISAEYDAKYTGLDVVIMVILIIAFIVLDISGRSRWLARDNKATLVATAGGCDDTCATTTTETPSAHNTEGTSLIGTLISLIPILSGLIIGFMYPHALSVQTL